MRIKIKLLYVSGAPKRYTVDLSAMRFLRLYKWRYMKRQNRACATTRYKQPREMLHKFIARKNGKNWVEVFFANNDPFDCRMGNLRPYDRCEEGAHRRRFKNNKTGYKGVFLKPSNATNKFGAAIRHRRKLRHLGYFPTAELAAAAYRKAYNLAHLK